MPPDRKAVFFDRDGTLMEEENYCNHPSRVKAIPGAAQALARLRENGWLNIIITNQSGIGRGYFTVAEYEQVHAELLHQLNHTVDAAYYCPDHPDQPSPRRKPETGMVEEASAEHHVSPAKSWFVGDKDIDVTTGKRSGCRTILVLSGYGEKHRDSDADYIAADVVEAVEIILSNP